MKYLLFILFLIFVSSCGNDLTDTKYNVSYNLPECNEENKGNQTINTSNEILTCDGKSWMDGQEYEQEYSLEKNSENTGIQGDKGDTGDKGDQGEQGEQGDQGDKGDKGDTGDQGIQGIQGDKGDTGDQGIQGVQGIQGNAGIDSSKFKVYSNGVEIGYFMGMYSAGNGNNITIGYSGKNGSEYGDMIMVRSNLGYYTKLHFGFGEIIQYATYFETIDCTGQKYLRPTTNSITSNFLPHLSNDHRPTKLATLW